MPALPEASRPGSSWRAETRWSRLSRREARSGGTAPFPLPWLDAALAAFSFACLALASAAATRLSRALRASLGASVPTPLVEGGDLARELLVEGAHLAGIAPDSRFLHGEEQPGADHAADQARGRDRAETGSGLGARGCDARRAGARRFRLGRTGTGGQGGRSRARRRGRRGSRRRSGAGSRAPPEGSRPWGRNRCRRAWPAPTPGRRPHSCRCPWWRPSPNPSMRPWAGGRRIGDAGGLEVEDRAGRHRRAGHGTGGPPGRADGPAVLTGSDLAVSDFAASAFAASALAGSTLGVPPAVAAAGLAGSLLPPGEDSVFKGSVSWRRPTMRPAERRSWTECPSDRPSRRRPLPRAAQVSSPRRSGRQSSRMPW